MNTYIYRTLDSEPEIFLVIAKKAIEADEIMSGLRNSFIEEGATNYTIDEYIQSLKTQKKEIMPVSLVKNGKIVETLYPENS